MPATTPPEPAPAPPDGRLPAPPPGGVVTAHALAQRVRIAGEIGDIVAHAVTALSVCASAAERQLRSGDGGAHESLRQVRAIAAEALADLRRLQALLHDGPPAYAPQPGLAELHELADAARRRGVAVQIAVSGEVTEVPPSLAMSVHRIVEAALAGLPAGGSPAVVDVEAGPCAVVLKLTRPATGMLDDARERVRLHGGSLDQGDGDQVTVTLPR